jgi:hypothetical protein
MAENKKAQRKKKLGKNKKNDGEEICKEKTPKIAEINSPKK